MTEDHQAGSAGKPLDETDQTISLYLLNGLTTEEQAEFETALAGSRELRDRVEFMRAVSYLGGIRAEEEAPVYDDAAETGAQQSSASKPARVAPALLAVFIVALFVAGTVASNISIRSNRIETERFLREEPDRAHARWRALRLDDDLDQRGLLDETLGVAVGEVSRSSFGPKSIAAGDIRLGDFVT